jgi:hypothetical protein
MIRAACRLLFIGILLLSIVGTAAAAPGRQSGAFLAAIIDFTADVSAVDYADVEAGNAQVTFTWHTINTNGQDRLALEAYLQDRWVSVLEPNEALPLNGSKTVTVALPQNFGTPTYRLTLKTSMNELIGQQFVTIPYTPTEPVAPSIASFTTRTESVDTNLLAQSNTRLVVSWDIEDRQPDTLIRFYQVLPDGTTVTAEPPRHSLWLPSEGEGAVLPRPTSSRDDLHFRMSLVNLSDNTVYDEADITIPVTGAVIIAASGGGAVAEAPAALTQSEEERLAIEAGNQISTFSAESSAAGDVTLSWDAGNAQSVELVETVNDGGPTTLYIQLPPSGTMSVPVPENSAGVTYTLRAQDASGTVATGEVSVAGSDSGG